MTQKQIEVCSYYRKLHPEALILFHLPGRYMVLGDDVRIATKFIHSVVYHSSDVAYFPDEILIIAKLGESGKEICLIEYLNDEGVLDLPDVNRIIAEKEIDY